MRSCSKCSEQIPNDAAFCPKCGANVSMDREIPNSRPVGGGTFRHLHCPRCKSTEITPLTESVGTVGGVGRVTKNVAVTSTSTINKSYWMCHSCGNKFRNIDDFEAEISQRKRRQKILNGLMIFIIAMLILIFISGIMVGSLLFGIVFDVIFGVPLIVVCRCFVKKTKQMEDECAQLKQDCFN